MTTCDTCQYWSIENLQGKLGECRRHAPRPVVCAQEEQTCVTWPLTAADDWCGEYEESEEIEYS